MQITKYIVQIPHEIVLDWTESRTYYTEIICGKEEEAIQIFRDIITNNFTYSGDKVKGHFYIIERVIDVEKFYAKDTELYYAAIYKGRVQNSGIKGEHAYLGGNSSSYYKKEYDEYQEEIKRLLTHDFPLIEESGKINTLYSLITDMRDQSLHYSKEKSEEAKYEKMKWWEN
jgi:hypothetical protein